MRDQTPSRRGLFGLMGGAAIAAALPGPALSVAESLTGGAAGTAMGASGSVIVNYAGRKFLFSKGGVIHFSGEPDYRVWCEGAEELQPHA